MANPIGIDLFGASVLDFLVSGLWNWCRFIPPNHTNYIIDSGRYDKISPGRILDYNTQCY